MKRHPRPASAAEVRGSLRQIRNVLAMLRKRRKQNGHVERKE
jgi:hypothetical protein